MSDPITPIAGLALKDVTPSADLGPRPALEWLPKDWLVIDTRYQRDAGRNNNSRDLIRRLVEGFCWRRFQPVTVADIGRQDGRFAVIDGGHRASAAMLHPAVTELPCWVIDAPELRDQAGTFVGINKDRIVMQPLQLYRAQLAAGDPIAAEVNEVCRTAGVEIAFALSHGQLRPGCTQAVSTIRKLIEKHGKGIVEEALYALAQAYPEKAGQIRGQVIEAVVALIIKHQGTVDLPRLSRVLAGRDCEALIADARNVRQLMGGTTGTAMVAALEAAYDKGRKPEQRLVAEKATALAVPAPAVPVALASPRPIPRPVKADPSLDILLTADAGTPLNPPLKRRCAKCTSLFMARTVGEVVCSSCSGRRSAA